MKKTLFFVLLISVICFSGCASKKENEMVFVKGGSFVNKYSRYYEKEIVIDDFYISKYEITGYEWKQVMGENPSEYKGDNLPVEMVSWYDAIEYCNKRSIMEGLQPYYNINKKAKDPNNRSEYDNLKWTVTINENANGYRLPTAAEWEYAASGGQESKNSIYSGGNKIEDVGWFWRNSGNEYLSGNWNWPQIVNNNNKPKAVGSLKPNELGIYDMSGNVREWCWDWYKESDDDIGGSYRVWKGGGWMGDEKCCEISYLGKFEANGKGSDTGLRVCRNK